MSRTSYGYIAFKLPHPEGADKDAPSRERRIQDEAQGVIKEMVNVLRSYGGETTTLKRVIENTAMAESGLVEHSGTQSIRSAVDGKRPRR